MNFSSKEDIEAPIEHVFASVTDFESFERAALRRGAEVERLDALETAGPGMRWVLTFDLRGKSRELNCELVEFEHPNKIVFKGNSQGLGGTMSVDLVALSRTRTRLSADVELQATTLSARLLLQSLKLARAKLNKRFHMRMSELALDIEDRAKRLA